MASPRELDALMGKAMNAHQAGRIAEAQKFYKAVLKEAPKHFPTLHFLGLTYFQEGKPQKGVEFVRKALAIKPDYVEAHYNLAAALQGLGRFEDAIEHYKQALAINPNNPDAHNNLGGAFHELKRYEEAIAHFQQALAINPGLAQSHNNIGSALRELRRYDEAVSHYQSALAINARNPETLCNLGAVFQQVGRFQDSLAACDAAATLVPGFAEAELGRGNALSYLSRLDDAVSAFDRALAIKPDLAEAWLGRGYACRGLNRYEDALSSYDKALACKPDVEYARGDRLYVKMSACDWSGFEADCAWIVADVERGRAATMPWLLLGVSPSAAVQLKCAQSHVRGKHPSSNAPIWNGERYSHDRIRIGYLSADMRNHAVAHLIVEIFERHDRTRVETFAFSFGADDGSALRARIVRAFDHFIDVSQKSDRDIANLIREMEIDVAVDLTGFTENARIGILAMRPAPTQVNYLGYPGTTGADYFDYIIADHIIIPAEHQPSYSEKVAYLPHSYQPTDTTRAIPATPLSRRDVGLPDSGFVFCSFNNSFKITPQIFDIWMKLLRSVDGSVLWLLEGHPSSDNLKREAQKRDVSPERLVFAPRVNPDIHLARHRLADVFLDTMPYNAHTTASDALWAGLPVLTCLGTAFAGRVAASIVTAAGLPELVTHSLQDYEALALRLTREPDLLASIKSKLAGNRLTQPLFDSARFVSDIEAAYTVMWERQRKGLTPEAFSVEPRA
jgi:protein O-GlcNAc transferase